LLKNDGINSPYLGNKKPKLNSKVSKRIIKLRLNFCINLI